MIMELNVSENLKNKYEALKTYLMELGSIAVGYSSGVDSTFLIKVAHEVLGDKAMAITVASSLFPKREMNEAIKFCQDNGIKHRIIEVDELGIPGFSENPTNRCYICKKDLFTRITEVANSEGISYVAEGSNMDDNGDYRPGLQAVAELGIKSPLRYVELYKDEIRTLSKAMDLPTWEKPSFACLASRFVYGEEITKDKLCMVEQAEDLLLEHGFKQFRVRIHGLVARIEVLPEDLPRFLDASFRSEVVDSLKAYGFTYVSLDLQGYRTGSMNETILKW